MNETKNWQIYRDLAMILTAWAQNVQGWYYFRLGLDELVYAFDTAP